MTTLSQFFLTNKINGIVYDMDYMTPEKREEKNIWMDRFGSKNITWMYEFERDNLHIKLKMIPNPHNNIFEGYSGDMGY